jgi:hypothetical protein
MRSDEIESYYRITHRQNWHGGSPTIKVAVTEETDEEIRGYKFKDSITRGHQFRGEIVVRKENVAAWEQFDPIPDNKSEHKIKEDYVAGRIDEEEMEQQLEQNT